MKGFAGYRLRKKLSALNENIKRWNREVLGMVDDSKEALVEIVEDLDKASEIQELQLDEVVARQDAERRI